MTPAHLKPKAEQAAEAIMSYHACCSGDCPHVKQSECFCALILAGYSQALEHLASEAGEYDKQAAIEQAKHEDSDGYFGFLAGAEWQHAQDAAREAALRASNADAEKRYQEQMLVTERLQGELAEARAFMRNHGWCK